MPSKCFGRTACLSSDESSETGLRFLVKIDTFKSTSRLAVCYSGSRPSYFHSLTISLFFTLDAQHYEIFAVKAPRLHAR